jgi:hypothetical protein
MLAYLKNESGYYFDVLKKDDFVLITLSCGFVLAETGEFSSRGAAPELETWC